MDFIKNIEDFYRYIISIQNSEDDVDFDPKLLVVLVDRLLLSGLVFRSRGLELLKQEQFIVLRDLINELTSMTDDRMRKIHEDMPKLFSILSFLDSVDKESYASFMYLLKP